VDAVAVVVVERKKRARPLSGRSGPQATRGSLISESVQVAPDHGFRCKCISAHAIQYKYTYKRQPTPPPSLNRERRS
jgi:hypothetical protein